MTNVLYILGSNRSGTTLLASLLNEQPGFFNAGEVFFLWWRNLRSAAYDRCGCGQPISRCGFWQEVLDEVDTEFRRRVGGDAATVKARLRDEMASSQERLLGDLRRSGRRVFWAVPENGSPLFRQATASLYASIARTAGARVVVDASKVGAYGDFLTMVPECRVSFVHLVRDPRGIVHSKLKRQEEANPGVEATGLLRAAGHWAVRNLQGELVRQRHRDSYLRVPYERLVAEPAAVLGDVARLVGEDPRGIEETREFRFTGNHSCGGNRMRFVRGEVRLVSDEAFRESLGGFEKGMVTLLLLPLLMRYDYPLRVGAPKRVTTL